MVKRFIKYYKNYRLMFALDMICALFAALISLFYPVITRKMINTYIPNGNIKMVIILSAVLLLVYILKAFLNYFIQRYGHNVGTRIQADMRRDLFSHMQTLPLSFFDKNKTGALLSRITSDLFDAAGVSSGVVCVFVIPRSDMREARSDSKLEQAPRGLQRLDG